MTNFQTQISAKFSPLTSPSVNHDKTGTFAAEAVFWVPIQGLNFALLPPHMHLSVVNFASILEACGLAYIQHSSIDTLLEQLNLKEMFEGKKSVAPAI